MNNEQAKEIRQIAELFLVGIRAQELAKEVKHERQKKKATSA